MTMDSASLGLFYLELAFELRLRTWPKDPSVALTGPAFRGALGNRLRTLSCLTNLDECQTCPFYAQCAFPMLFAPDNDTPRPFFLKAPAVFDDGRVEFQLTLIGSAITHAPLVIAAVRQMGEDCTIARLRFDVCAVRARTNSEEWASLPDGFRSCTPDPIARFADIARLCRQKPVTRATVNLLSPLQIRHDRHVVRHIDAGVFLERVVRRAHALEALYCGGTSGDGQVAAILERVRNVRLHWTNTSFVQGATWSYRQHEHVGIDGIVGAFEMAGELDVFAPYLRVAQAVGVGKKTTRGCGECAVDLR